MNGNYQTIVNRLSSVLSLRKPQKDALEILSRVCELVNLSKKANVEEVLQTINEQYPTVEDFEHSFPSLCFSLATGVGKTRLMGAFIAFLYKAGVSKDFLIVAPNLTVYDKLREDFSNRQSPKYVFKGVSDMLDGDVTIVTGETYERGNAVKRSERLFGGCIVNIFNISKINSEVRGGKTPKIKRLNEFIGDSYFNYLSELDDLVMLMDESHHYRATAGLKSIEELSPILGLEVTATPQVVSGSKYERFKNIIYDYPLASAMDDGFVKEPAVATRADFNPAEYPPEELEKIKLEDGVRLHERTKLDLEVYSREHDAPYVKPFMLVIARDTKHADDLQKTIESDQFFDGSYRGKVTRVDSQQKGAEKEENIARLLEVENPEEPTEIVIHVDMLKEGWDVTNLYTVVPLRAANSRTLVEQSIGRGLRLPYGKRTGITPVDRLTIVSHDKFKEIVDYAKSDESSLRHKMNVIDVAKTVGHKLVVAPSIFESMVNSHEKTGTAESYAKETGISGVGVQQKLLFSDPEERIVAETTYEVIGRLGRLGPSVSLQKPENHSEVVREVQRELGKRLIGSVISPKRVSEVVAETTKKFAELSIDIPRIVVIPKDDSRTGFVDFDLDCRSISLNPLSGDIFIQHLHDGTDGYIVGGKQNTRREAYPENYIYRGLLDKNDVNDFHDAKLIEKLSKQVIQHIRSTYQKEDDVENVVFNHQKQLVEFVYSQMTQHRATQEEDFEIKVSQNFQTLKANSCTIASSETPRDFSRTLQEGERSQIKSMIFNGFKKCLYLLQKFDSNSELEFARILERDSKALKWFRPTAKLFQIRYTENYDQKEYIPDFVVETSECKLLCEIKSSKEMNQTEVQNKAKAARQWARTATTVDKKPWKYLLIPHDEILQNSTLSFLESSFEYKEKKMLS